MPEGMPEGQTLEKLASMGIIRVWHGAESASLSQGFLEIRLRFA